MITLTATEIIAVVQRSLQDLVAPELRSDFARVQLAAAIRALDEVASRIEHGDPCSPENDRLLRAMLGLAGELRADAPALASRLERAAGEAAAIDDPRRCNRYLKDTLSQILVESQGPAVRRVVQLVTENLKTTAEADAAWMCPEAVSSVS